jgi:hypothetical protein
LAALHPDHQIAAQLNDAGLRTRTGKPWTYARVHVMRKQHGIPTGCPLHTRDAAARADGMVPVTVAAKRLGVSSSLVHVWVRHGVLRHDQHRSASRVWVRLNADDFARLDGSSKTGPGLPSFAHVQRTECLAREDLWHRVRRGEYQAFRVRHGQLWQWHLQQAAGLGV